jgi:uncharacterized protein YcbX
MSSIEIVGMGIAPLKSGAFVYLPEALVTPRGLADPVSGVENRQFAVIDNNNNRISQREVEQMALIAPKLGERTMRLTAPGMEEIKIPLQKKQKPSSLVLANIGKHRAYGHLVGPDLDEWLGDFLPPYKDNKSYRLIRTVPDLPRAVPMIHRRKGASNLVGFADAAALSLSTVPSLRDVNTIQQKPTGNDRWRMDLLVDGNKLEAFDEDYWEEMLIGDLEAYNDWACSRCTVPDVDQQIGQRRKGVIKALSQIRRGTDQTDGTTGTFYGINLNFKYRPNTILKRGDKLVVISRRATPNPVPRKK